MAHAFDGPVFSRALSDVGLLSRRALDHERRLTDLVTRIEQDESGRSNELLELIREACVEARDNRLLAETTAARLVGTHAAADTARLVLVVDDFPDSRDMAAAVLDNAGYQALTAGNGLEAVIVAHYALPAFVLMDVTMPVLDGVEATRRLKASAATHHLPVVAYTATTGFHTNTGRLFSDVLAKPASPQSILALARRFAGGEGREATTCGTS